MLLDGGEINPAYPWLVYLYYTEMIKPCVNEAGLDALFGVLDRGIREDVKFISVFSVSTF